jgi:hypothetical protein
MADLIVSLDFRLAGPVGRREEGREERGLMAHCRDISMRAFQNTYPCASEPSRGEDINANVTVVYEKLGVNGTIHAPHLFPLCKATLRCDTAVR